MTEKVQLGQAWRPSSRLHNRLVDLANSLDTGATPATSGTRRTPGAVLVKNSSGADTSLHGVLALSGAAVFDASDNTTEFDAGNVALVGVAADVEQHAGQFAVLLEPIANGSLGLGLRCGLTPCRLQVDAEWHKFADVSTGTTELVSKPGGGARILYKESGTGSGLRAYVELCAATHVFCRFSLSSALADTEASKSATISECNVPGYAGETITVYNMTASSNYVFSGDASDQGLAQWNAFAEQWQIYQMECP